ncbi:MAG: hypothetical protein R3C69_04190 [Geminicoccaceae bacterium]
MGVARTFQLVRTLPSLTLTENVMVAAAFGAATSWGDAARTVALRKLEVVGLVDRMAETAAELTHIDQKRLELARALAAEPSCAAVDEWLAGLNPTELDAGIELVRSLTRSASPFSSSTSRGRCRSRLFRLRVLVMNSAGSSPTMPTDVALADPAVIAAYIGDDEDSGG